MSATATAADPTSTLAKTEPTTAFDQDRQHEEDPSYTFRLVTSIRNSFFRRKDLEKAYVGWASAAATKDDETPSVESWIRRNPWADSSAELEQSSDRLRNDTFNAYRDRIEMLKRDADDEGIIFNDTSEQDFWEFMRSIPHTLKADIVVTDSGNLRAVWRGDGVKHVGLQFLGERWIEYVMWTRLTGSMNIWTKAGRDTFEDVKERIRASRLASFLQ